MFSVKASLKGNISFSFKLFSFDVYFLFALLSNQLFFEIKAHFLTPVVLFSTGLLKLKLQY